MESVAMAKSETASDLPETRVCREYATLYAPTGNLKIGPGRYWTRRMTPDAEPDSVGARQWDARHARVKKRSQAGKCCQDIRNHPQ